ncbi:methyltransferase domain-containing protein [Mangrovicoccus algicola]|uniref:Methyltransferase domain-containing protein n=1 Tax=Mangrovicoccus algicola TaxID=2771008 RepID=A0A8J6Z8C3_9RHOB|nr:methyltransferase domain-containing protein [Mangrovicoccus algicola]MBE3638255.1 methyltransferase domain-containing protein [Mangrovicoccus algicola]
MTDAPVAMTDRAALCRARRRARQAGGEALFLHRLARDGIEERLSMVNRPLRDVAVVTGHPQAWRDLRPGARLVEDAPLLDLAPGSCDLVVHAMALHWAEDPVGQLVQCRRALRPDGLCLAVFFGGTTLSELRASLAEAEAALTGGLSPRILPMGEIRQLGALLQRAGLSLPVADAERHAVQYRSVLHLMQDLRAMGETNALAARPRGFTRRDVMLEAARRYPGAPEGPVQATFELVTLTGWAPDASQPRPLRPGSAAARLADALNVSESPLPDTGN